MQSCEAGYKLLCLMCLAECENKWFHVSIPYQNTQRQHTTCTKCQKFLLQITHCSFIFASFTHPPTHSTRTPHRVPQRQISLYKFISTCSDLLPAPLFPALMHMLVGLASSTHSAHHTFNYLKANSPSLGMKEGVSVCVIQSQVCFFIELQVCNKTTFWYCMKQLVLFIVRMSITYYGIGIMCTVQ